MKKSKQSKELILSGIVVGISAITVLTCSALGGRKAAYQPEWFETSAEQAKPATTDRLNVKTFEDAKAPSPLGRWVGATDLGQSEEGNAIPRLPRFYEALARLKEGLRHDHVRIVWLGDSHTQADVWTHTVRSKLQSEFGNGGPGFIHIGWDTYGYRHEHVGLRIQGTWAIRPMTLVSVTRVEDGVFGLGGIKLVPRGIDSEASLIVRPDGLPGKGNWDLAVRFTKEDAQLVVTIDGAQHKLEAHKKSLRRIRHAQFESKGPGGTLRVEQTWNRPEFMGVVVEAADRHGVVLDTLGLNGARVRSALAWNESAWVSELSRRQADLVVLAFGTNESSNLKLRTERHTQRVRELVARIRKAAPNGDCLIFGPIDRSGLEYSQLIQRINAAQQRVAQEVGCAFWNGQQAMGGAGSMQAWASKSPPLAAGDRIHLYPRGYTKLGGMMVRDILQGYHAGMKSETNDGASTP
ncbi:MAG: hypothetical protein CSA75_04090 [Sorangium cellulosum]|nr:MAG: hypothetical protein CSA75_04090 [Sorangium cellulosum]